MFAGIFYLQTRLHDNDCILPWGSELKFNFGIKNYFMPSLGMSGATLPPPLSLHGVRRHSFIFLLYTTIASNLPKPQREYYDTI